MEDEKREKTAFLLKKNRIQKGKREKKKKPATLMGKKKQISGAAKRKKKKEKEEAIKEAAADLERLKLGPTKLWTGLVTHHRDIFVSHVLPKLNDLDRFFFARANIESLDLLINAGVNVLEGGSSISDCSSISMLEWAWNTIKWGEKLTNGSMVDKAWFCWQVAATDKLELLKWVREEKKCDWDERTISVAAEKGNLEMLKYCFANNCPYDERESCRQAAARGHLDCLRFLFDNVKPSKETEKKATELAAQYGQLDILKYFVEERKISDDTKSACMAKIIKKGHHDCFKYMLEEAKTRLDDWRHIAHARLYEQPEFLHYLREKGCPEPTDDQYSFMVYYYSAKNQQ